MKEMTDYKEFVKSVKKVNQKRVVLFKRSMRAKDAFINYRQVKLEQKWPPISQNGYHDIIKAVNLKLVQKFKTDHRLVLPEGLGVLEFGKYTPSVRINKRTGKLIIGRRINWNKTLELWYNDEDAKARKSKIYHENKECHKVKYNVDSRNYTNGIYMIFKIDRSAIKYLCENVGETYELNHKYNG